MAWQFDRPDINAGVVQVFRRNDCPVEKLMLKIKGLGPNLVYSVTNFDSDEIVTKTGKALMEKGVDVVLIQSQMQSLSNIKKWIEK